MGKDNNDAPIPGMNLDRKYDAKSPAVQQNLSEAQKEMEKTKKELDKVKGFILKKYPFVQSIGILPPQAVKLFMDEEEVPKESEKFIHMYMIVPEEKFKEIPKIKPVIVKELEKLKQKVWLQIKTPVDVWDMAMDGKYELFSGAAMSYPLYDKGFLGLMRLTEIHKSLVLQKFEKYVVSYVVVGSFIRGEADKTSDADVAIIINDTDVKRMPRLELKERLRSIIAGQHLSEAVAMAGVKNTLHVQTYLLTDFWEAVKDAHPVMFTFIRDGVPIYDRGTFMPWKTLLKMGKLKPTPEAIDMFMKTAEKTKEMAQRRLLDAMIDIYYGVLNPSQALIMLYGLPPPTHKEAPKIMEEVFVKKEKMLTKADIAIFEKAVKLFKQYEHDPKMTISGQDIAKLIEDSEKYLKKLGELRTKIEKSAQERTIEQLYSDVFDLLKNIFGKKAQSALVTDFESMVKKGKFTSQHLKILKDVISARAQFKKGKLDTHKIDAARRNSARLVNDLLDYTQRCELASMDKKRIPLKYGKDKRAELIVTDGQSFLFVDNTIKKITSKIEASSSEEVSNVLESQKNKKNVEVSPKVFELIKKELGNFEIVF